jgi:hypothetical protein
MHGESAVADQRRAGPRTQSAAERARTIVRAIGDLPLLRDDDNADRGSA